MNRILYRRAAVVGAILAACGVQAALAADAAVENVEVRAVARFGFDRTSINAEDQAKILAEVGQLKDVTWQSVTATGHTDSVGSPKYNEKLSARRAQAVKKYLVGKGLDPNMIKAVAGGVDAPVAPNDTDQGRAENRRTEIEFAGVRTAK